MRFRAIRLSAGATALAVLASACHDIQAPVAPHQNASRPRASLGTPNSWTSLAPLPEARFGTTSANLGGLLYVVGGGTSLPDGYAQVDGHAFTYNPLSNQWTALPNTLDQVAYAAAAAPAGSGKVYMVGGCASDADCRIGTTGDVEAYDPQANSWTMLSPLLTPRSAASAVDWNGNLWVVGGMGPCPPCEPVNTIEMLQLPGTGPFQVHTTIPNPRVGMAVVALGSKLYLFGGGTQAGYTTEADVYDPVSNGWTTLAPMPVLAASLGAAAANGIIYVVAGQVWDANQNAYVQSNQVLAYDPVANTWSNAPPIPTARYETFPQTIGGVIYVAANGAGNLPSAALEAFTPPSPYQPPIFMGSIGTPLSEGMSGNLILAASDQTGAPMTLTVSFGDGSPNGTGSCTPPAAGQSCTTSIPHTFEAGSYQASVTISDGIGSSTTGFQIAVANVPPMLPGIGGATIFAGDTYTTQVPFTDPGQHETYTATIDYGDGTTQPSFAVTQSTPIPVSHTYASPCTCTITLQVTDSHGGTGSATGQITVQTPAQAAQTLSNTVASLGTAGLLGAGDVNALQASLTVAIAHLKNLTSVLSVAHGPALHFAVSADASASANGDAHAAVNELQAFINKVQALERSGRLAAANGDPLIQAAQAIIAHVPE